MAAVAKRTLVFYYDIVCPFTYVAAHKLAAAAPVVAKHGVQVQWKPVLLGALYKATHAPQGKDGSASDVMNAAKRAVSGRDLRIQAERAGASLLWNSNHPVRTLAAMRLLAMAPQEKLRDVTMSLFRAYWENDQDVSDVSMLRRVAAEHGLSDVDIESEEAKDTLRANTEEAIERGAFGVPSFWSTSAEALFWGEDRLHLALHAEGVPKEEAVPRRLAPFDAAAAARSDALAEKPVLTFYHDFASPWSYVASTQVERVARENGARVEYVPILLGALFKTIGTPNVPLLAMAPAKRTYMSKDLRDWCTWRGIDLNFPSAFPIRTVLPLRVAIQRPELTPLLYRAAWCDDRNIGDEAELRSVLEEAGCDDVDALLAGTKHQDVKNTLFANTERARDVGACGVPSFQVDGSEVLWGQDRLDVVADMLCGWRPAGSPPPNDGRARSKL